MHGPSMVSHRASSSFVVIIMLYFAIAFPSFVQEIKSSEEILGTDCTGWQAGVGRETTGFGLVDQTGSPAASICSFRSRARSASSCRNDRLQFPVQLPGIFAGERGEAAMPGGNGGIRGPYGIAVSPVGSMQNGP